MAAAAGKGSAQNINSLYFKPMLRKAYHRKSSTWADMVAGDSTVKLKGGREEEEDIMIKAMNSSKNKNSNVKSFVNHEGEEDHHHEHPRRSWSTDQNDDSMNLWVPDNRTGIYYPKGQEKVMEDVSPLAGKDLGINWFSHP